jgi:hypothetical protein
MPPDEPDRMYDDANIYRNGKKLAAILGSWHTQKDLDRFLMDDIGFINWFQPYNTYLKKTQGADKANEQTQLSVVLSRLRAGEANSKRRFSRPTDEDVKTWKEPEQLAHLLYTLRDNLVDAASGTFHELEWSERVIHQRLWFMIQRARFLRRDKTPKEKREVIQEPIMPRVGNLSTRSAQVIRRVKKKLAVQARAPATDGKGKKPKVTLNPRIAKQKQLQMDNEATRAHEELKPVLTDEEREALVALTEEEWEDLMMDVEDEEWYELAKASSSHVSSSSFRKRPAMTPELSAEINAEILEEAGVVDGAPPRYMPRISHAERFWQLYIIVSALTGVTVRDVTGVPKAVDVFACVLAGRGMRQSDSHRMAEANADLAAGAQVRAEEAGGATGSRRAMDFDLVPLSFFEQEASLGSVSELLARKEYERTRFRKACQYLRINPRPSDGRLRPALTNRNFNAYWWQITGAWNLLAMHDSGWCRGGILADLVGLGKTFTLGMVMLFVSSRHQSEACHSADWLAEGELCTVTRPPFCLTFALHI